MAEEPKLVHLGREHQGKLCHDVLQSTPHHDLQHIISIAEDGPAFLSDLGLPETQGVSVQPCPELVLIGQRGLHKRGNGVNSGLKNWDPFGVGYHMFWFYGSRWPPRHFYTYAYKQRISTRMYLKAICHVRYFDNEPRIRRSKMLYAPLYASRTPR
jgi:hypothetical protein